VVVGDLVHDGVRYFLIRQSHGSSYQVPEWMLDQEAGAFAIVAVPRLPVGQLILVRDLVDQLMTYSPASKDSGGIGREKVVAHATGFVRHTCRTGGGVDRLRAAEGSGPSPCVTDRGDGAGDQQPNDSDRAGGQR